MAAGCRRLGRGGKGGGHCACAQVLQAWSKGRFASKHLAKGQFAACVGRRGGREPGGQGGGVGCVWWGGGGGGAGRGHHNLSASWQCAHLAAQHAAPAPPPSHARTPLPLRPPTPPSLHPTPHCTTRPPAQLGAQRLRAARTWPPRGKAPRQTNSTPTFFPSWPPMGPGPASACTTAHEGDSPTMNSTLQCRQPPASSVGTHRRPACTRVRRPG